MPDVLDDGARPASGGESEPPGYTLAHLRFPIDEFVLGRTLATLPDVEFECEGVVQSSNVVMPLVWARGAGREALEAAFGEDPTVENATLVALDGDELLYHVEWGSRVRTLAAILTDSDAVIRDARGSDEGWSVRVLFASRDHLARACEVCEGFEIGVSVRAIHDVDAASGTLFGLTEDQREALVAAHRQGYFEVPRGAELEDVAEELGISHQSLSERLRRAHDVLVENTLLDRDSPEE